MKLSKRVKRGVTYLLARGLIALLNIVPRRLALFVGAMLGLTAWAILDRDRHKISRHLSLAYSDTLSTEQRKNIGRGFFVGSGKNMADALRFKKHFTTEIRPLVTVEGIEHLEKAYSRGRGVIGVTGHLGNFELLAVYIASLGYDVAVIGREAYDPRLDVLLAENREATGLTVILTSDSPRKALKWLKKGGILGVLIDTDSIRVRGMFVPALGRLALTPVGQTIMGLRTGAAFVVVACLRTDDNRYRVVVRPEIQIEPSGDFDNDVYRITAACTRELDSIIHEHKDQWIWLNNRWLTSPQNRA